MGTIGVSRTSIVNVERLLVDLFRSEVKRFAAEPDELRRFFNHYFKPLVGDEEREDFVLHFQRETPDVVLGYARTSTQFPCFAIVLAEESESSEGKFIGDFAGNYDEDVDPDQPHSYYNGAIWDATYEVHVFAQHPDVCLYLYHFAKMIVIAGMDFLLSNGLLKADLSGHELAPQEQYQPDNMFARVLRITTQSPQTVPIVGMVDARRLKVLGLYRDDVVVDGIRGGVSTPEGFDGTEEEDAG
jgi:hypothetical protein